MNVDHSQASIYIYIKLQYFGHLMWRVDSLEKTLMLGGIGAGGEGDNRGWDGWMASLTRWTWVSVNSRSWWRTGWPSVLQSWGRKESDMTERLKGTELNWTLIIYYSLQTKGSPGGSVVKYPPLNTGDSGDMGFIPGSRRSPGVWNGNPSSILAWKIP